MSVFISVILCTYNRARLLERALCSLSRQTISLDHFEVIVVDDGSQDDTETVCKKMFHGLPNLRYVSTGINSGASSARNLGITASVGDYLLFTDDDCIVADNWIERMADALNKEPIVAGAVASPIKNYFKLCHNIAQFHEFMPGQKEGPKDFLVGANMAFHRSVLKELDGFKSCEEDVCDASDMEIILRARSKGYSTFFEPAAIVMHDPNRTSMSDILKYSAVHSAVTIHLRNRYRELLNTPFILLSPFLLIAAAPVVALKVTAGIYLSNPKLARYISTAPVVYALKLAWCWGAASSLRKKRRADKER
jgi:glycosyltransferase involved in cell wall biosynthesis